MGPERETESQIIVSPTGNPGEFELVDTCAETEVASLLGFLGQINSRWAVVRFTDRFGETQTITAHELRRDDTDQELDHDTFLRKKAHELLCGSDVRINLVDPDALDINNDFNPF